jgi:hypothetical protein
MWTFFGSLIISMLGCLGAAMAIVLLARWAMISAFEALPRSGAGRLARQLVAVPIVGLLSRERRARRGDHGSLFALAGSQFVLAGVISLVVQGFLPAIGFTAILLIAGYLTLQPR